MNAQQIATSTAPSPHLLDAINAGLSPYMLGALDAGCGRERTPGEYYIWAGDMAEYNEGYADEAQDAAHRGPYRCGGDDYAAGRYAPPKTREEHDDYIRGYNDAWKTAENVKWFRR